MPTVRAVVDGDLDEDITRLADEADTSRAEILRRALLTYWSLASIDGLLDPERGELPEDILSALEEVASGEEPDDGQAAETSPLEDLEGEPVPNLEGDEGISDEDDEE